MPESFFDHPILTSPYEYPARHWKLDAAGQPTERVVESRRRAEFITPIPGPKRRWRGQKALVYDEGQGHSTEAQTSLDGHAVARRLVARLRGVVRAPRSERRRYDVQTHMETDRRAGSDRGADTGGRRRAGPTGRSASDR